VEKLGGIQAIVISHPHFYSAMCAWGLRFGAPVYVHEVRKSPAAAAQMLHYINMRQAGFPHSTVAVATVLTWSA
jgi:hypothetical protein